MGVVEDHRRAIAKERERRELREGINRSWEEQRKREENYRPVSSKGTGATVEEIRERRRKRDLEWASKRRQGIIEDANRYQERVRAIEDREQAKSAPKRAALRDLVGGLLSSGEYEPGSIQEAFGMSLRELYGGGGGLAGAVSQVRQGEGRAEAGTGRSEDLRLMVGGGGSDLSNAVDTIRRGRTAGGARKYTARPGQTGGTDLSKLVRRQGGRTKPVDVDTTVSSTVDRLLRDRYYKPGIGGEMEALKEDSATRINVARNIATDLMKQRDKDGNPVYRSAAEIAEVAKNQADQDLEKYYKLINQEGITEKQRNKYRELFRKTYGFLPE